MNASFTVTLQMQVATNAASPLTNTGSVTTTDFDPTTPDNAPVTTTILPSADLSITELTTTPAPNYVGADLVYTIMAANNGPSDATGVTVVNTLPANVIFISATGGATPDGTSKVTFSVGTLASGGTKTFTITVQPTAAAVAASPSRRLGHGFGHRARPEHRQRHTDRVNNGPCPALICRCLISPIPNPVDAGQNLDLHDHGNQQRPLGCDRRDRHRHDSGRRHVRFGDRRRHAGWHGQDHILEFRLWRLVHPQDFLVTVTATGTTASPTTRFGHGLGH